MKKYLILSLLCVFAGLNGWAQQENQFTLFNRNGLYYNPGFTGMEGYLNIGLTYRKQWTGFEDAPRVFGLNAHGRFSEENTHKGEPPFSLRISNTSKYDELGQNTKTTKYLNHAMGGYIIHDKYSPYEDITAALTYAYHLPLTDEITWSVGAALGVTNSKLYAGGLEVVNQQDPTFKDYQEEGTLSEYNFDLGLGTVIYTDNLYASYSIKQFLNQENFVSDSAEGSQLTATHFIGTGYVFQVSDAVEIYPSVLLKYVNATPLAINALLKARINNIFTVGAGYERDNTALGLVGFNLNNSFNVTYSYGFQFGEIKEVQSGNHAINLNVALFNWSNKPVSLMW